MRYNPDFHMGQKLKSDFAEFINIAQRSKIVVSFFMWTIFQNRKYLTKLM
jgi:hypothetical protein